jgi:4'-phosphopantetheinyl transferase
VGILCNLSADCNLFWGVFLLSAGEVHLWRASVNTIEQPEIILSGDEMARAKRLLQLIDQTTFMGARSVLRCVLSRYLSVSPAHIQFEVTEHGKPFVRGTDIQFNLSHSGEAVLIGVTRGRSIGVDVERIREQCDYLNLAKRFFLPAECAAIESAEKPIDAFYRCWTRKEASLKAMGMGLSFGLSNVEVSVVALGEAVSGLLSIKDSVDAATEWLVQSVPVQDAYFGAVAVQKPVSEILYYDFTRDFC